MNMATTTDIGSLITSSPGICGGRVRIAGTGVSVRRIVGWYKMGMGPEEIAEQYGHLRLAQVYAALSYYHANQEAMEAEMAAEEAEYNRLEAAHRATRGTAP
jgi:uncharacterized protein (DUF433 family)